MDFLKDAVENIAALIDQLSEVPFGRREVVATEVVRLKKVIKTTEPIEAVAIQVEPEAVSVAPETTLTQPIMQPTDDLDTHTVAELRVIAEDYPAITQVIYLRKAELITAIRTARLNEVTQ